MGWGSTYGSINTALDSLKEKGIEVAHLHLKYLNPLPENLGEVLNRYENIMIPEMNMGQLQMVLQGKFMKPIINSNPNDMVFVFGNFMNKIR